MGLCVLRQSKWIREEAKPIEKEHQVATYLGLIPREWKPNGIEHDEKR